MLETRTRLNSAIPASRSAISKLVSFSLWRPTPRVRKIREGTNLPVTPFHRSTSVERFLNGGILTNHARLYKTFYRPVADSLQLPSKGQLQLAFSATEV